MKEKERTMPALKKSSLVNIFPWEIWGIPFIIILGALLHFTFELSDGFKPLGVISAVNESVWEHLKLAFWPSFFWSFIEYYFVRRTKKDTHPNFLFAKAVGTYVMPLVIMIIFYTYTAFTSDSILAVDLASFVIAVILGQFVSFYLWRGLRLPAFNWIGLLLFLIAIVLFAIFTFYPPHAGLFQDPPTGGYGILE
jgi:hypothetical protein